MKSQKKIIENRELRSFHAHNNYMYLTFVRPEFIIAQTINYDAAI